MKFGIALGALNPHFHLDATLEAERLGYESVWLPEHLVFTRAMSRSPHPGRGPPAGAARHADLRRVRVPRVPRGEDRNASGSARTCSTSGCAIRSPTARGVQTVDLLSGGRFEFGIGASWLEEEWVAAQLDFATRGRRVDEALEICKRLWTEETVTHHGEFFSFDEVAFEPKPVQQPWPPILVGGESKAALRRAARLGDGWIGMAHTLESAPRRSTRCAGTSTSATGMRTTFRVRARRSRDRRSDVDAVGGARCDPHDRLTVAPFEGGRRGLSAEFAARFGENTLG